MSNLLATLSIICPKCDHLNAPGARKCESCRAVLVDERKGARRPPPSEQPSAAARKGEVPSEAAAASPTSRGPAAEPAASASAPGPAIPRTHVAYPAPPPLGSMERPIPASELVKKRSARLPPSAATVTNFGLSVLAGSRRGERFRLPALIVIGSRHGNLVFSDDPFLSPQHATLTMRNGRLHLRDDASASGVFASIAGHEVIMPGAFFSVGQRLFRYLGVISAPRAPTSGILFYGAPLPHGQLIYGLEEVLIGARPGRIAVTTTQVLSIGQHNCDVSFPGETGLAPRHCELTLITQGAILRDLSAGLGTFVRIPPGTERPLNVGDLIRVGQEILRVDVVA